MPLGSISSSRDAVGVAVVNYKVCLPLPHKNSSLARECAVVVPVLIVEGDSPQFFEMACAFGSETSCLEQAARFKGVECELYTTCFQTKIGLLKKRRAVTLDALALGWFRLSS